MTIPLMGLPALTVPARLAQESERPRTPQRDDIFEGLEPLSPRNRWMPIDADVFALHDLDAVESTLARLFPTGDESTFALIDSEKKALSPAHSPEPASNFQKSPSGFPESGRETRAALHSAGERAFLSPSPFLAPLFCHEALDEPDAMAVSVAPCLKPRFSFGFVPVKMRKRRAKPAIPAWPPLSFERAAVPPSAPSSAQSASGSNGINPFARTMLKRPALETLDTTSIEKRHGQTAEAALSLSRSPAARTQGLSQAYPVAFRRRVVADAMATQDSRATAFRFRLSLTTVRRWVQEARLETKPSAHKRQFYAPEMKTEAVALCQKTQNLQQVAQGLGVPIGLLREWLDREQVNVARHTPLFLHKKALQHQERRVLLADMLAFWRNFPMLAQKQVAAHFGVPARHFSRLLKHYGED